MRLLEGETFRPGCSALEVEVKKERWLMKVLWSEAGRRWHSEGPRGCCTSISTDMALAGVGVVYMGMLLPPYYLILLGIIPR